MFQLSPEQKERFWSKVNKTSFDGCWLWTAAKLWNGYGRVGLSGVKHGWILAHRLSLILAGYDLPDDKLVLHTCNNRACVNPMHLYVGTHSNNLRDRAMTTDYILKTPTHKPLHWDEEVWLMQHLRTHKITLKQIGKMFKCSESYVCNVTKGMSLTKGSYHSEPL